MQGNTLDTMSEIHQRSETTSETNNIYIMIPFQINKSLIANL